MPVACAVVVDDDQTLVQLLVTQLQRLGVHTIGCHSHEQARDALRKLQPDLLIADVKLPDGDGLSLCESPHARDACRILMTGFRDTTLASQALHRKAHLLPKTGDLWTQVHRIVRAHVRLPSAA